MKKDGDYLTLVQYGTVGRYVYLKYVIQPSVSNMYKIVVWHHEEYKNCLPLWCITPHGVYVVCNRKWLMAHISGVTPCKIGDSWRSIILVDKGCL